MPTKESLIGKRWRACHAVFLLPSLALLTSCSTIDGTKVTVLNAVKIPTIIGTIELDFGQEEKRKVDSPGKLAESPKGEAQVAASTDSLNFRAYEFDTAPLPAGCKPFDIGRYGNLLFPNDGAAVSGIEKKVDDMKAELGHAPDEAVIALATYKSTAFQSVCGPVATAKLKPGSRINGWTLTPAALKLFGSAGQEEIDVTPKITIIAVDKKEFEGHLKATAGNLLLSMFRFEIPPNTDSIASDPKTGSLLLAYSERLEDVTIGSGTRHVIAGGVMRIFVGKHYIYVINFFTNTEGVSERQSAQFRKYLDSFRYVGESTS